MANGDNSNGGNLAENKFRSTFAHDILVVLRYIGFYTKLDRQGSKVRIRVQIGPKRNNRFLLVIPQRGENCRVTWGDTRLQPLDAKLGETEPQDVAREFAQRIVATGLKL
ncbi:hypothetical protein [Micromonospora chersina]|uniref:hypothetical protein n=1 Tax=Micromonospora chersina TaxID=47854 RepID=UPI00339DC0CE